MIASSSAACAEDPKRACVELELEGPIQAVTGMRPERMYYARSGAGAVLGGFDGALEAPGRIVSSGGVLLAEVVPDPHGRFLLDVPPSDRITVEAEGGSIELRLRDPSEARGAAVACRPLTGAGDTPNDLLIGGTPSDPYGVLVRSGDGGVNAIDLAGGLEDGVRIEGSPFMAAVVGGASRRIGVTDFRNGTVHVVDLDARRIERTLGPPPPVTLDAPHALPAPYDVDRDGVEETTVSRFTPSTPQALVVASDKIVVGYVSFLSSSPAIFLPGVIAVWTASDLDRPPRTVVLPFPNPQEVRLLEDGRVLVVCSGTLDIGDLGSPSEGGLVFFDPTSESIESTIPLRDFLPGTAILAADRLIVGSLGRAEIRVMGTDGSAPVPIRLNEEAVDTVYRMVALDGGLVAVPSFNTDRLHILDARTGILDPAPFFGPLEVGPGRPIFDGLQVVARRPGRPGVDFTGPDLYALRGVASEVVAIELRKLLGP